MKAAKSEQEKLLALQALDSSLMQLEHKSKSLPASKLIEEKSSRLASVKDLIVAAETEKSDIKFELSKSESDVEQVVSRIEKDEKRLAAGQGTPKELEQLQHELGSLAKRRAELEEVELEVMVKVEALDKHIATLSAERDALNQELEALKVSLSGDLSEIESAKAKNSSERAALATSIVGDLIALYEKIRGSSDGVGAARLAQGKCEGCHLTMNAAEVARVKALPDDEVVRCEECRRILVRV